MSNQSADSEVNIPEPDKYVSQIMRRGFGGEMGSMPPVDQSVRQIARFTDTRKRGIFGENG